MTSQDSNRTPVSVIMAVRDERMQIEPCLEAILGQEYASDRLEVLVADGDSRDGTREIVERLAADDGRIAHERFVL